MHPDRRGFVLPTTLMVMTLLTVMLTAAFVMISAEFRTSDNSLAISRANALAQAGLQDYLSRNRGLGIGASWDSIRITYSSGYADIVGTRLVAQSGNHLPMWVIRSTAVLTANALTGSTTASSTAAQLTQLNSGSLPLKAAFIAANPIQFIGTGLPAITGQDSCSSNIDTVGLVAASTDIYGASGVTLTRNFSRAAILDSTHIDWASLLAGNFTPDFTVPSWPSTYSGYPVYYSSGDLTLSTSRVGILVVRGNLTMGTFSSWKGIVIVGGHLVGAANNFALIEGSVITGLNNLITPNSAGTDTIYRSSFFTGFHWDSCENALAVAGMIGMSPLKHTFIDTWAP
jgi:hypothetical protein